MPAKFRIGGSIKQFRTAVRQAAVEQQPVVAAPKPIVPLTPKQYNQRRWGSMPSERISQ